MDTKQYYILPSMNYILNTDTFSKLKTIYDIDVLKKIINQELNSIRENLENHHNSSKQDIVDYLFCKTNEHLNFINNRFEKLINTTGIIAHTNIGRAPIAKNAIYSSTHLSSYLNLEYDKISGQRVDRNIPVKEILNLIFGSEDAIVVNNNAAAIMLISNTFSKNKNILISRGECIEIGDNFRILDIIHSSGANTKEVGSTNRTNMYDYENAIDEATTAIIKVNKSNYEILGFSQDVPIDELSKLCKSKNLVLVEDLGSGNMLNLLQFPKQNNRTIQNALSDGADLICFSTDKMMSSCQGSVILGSSKYIEKLKQNPLFRTVRVGKTTLITLYETFKLYLRNDKQSTIPIINILSQSEEDIYNKASAIHNYLTNSTTFISNIEKSKACLGGGISNKFDIDSYCVSIRHQNLDTNTLNDLLRNANIIPYIKDDYIKLDVLCINSHEIDEIIDFFRCINSF